MGNLLKKELITRISLKQKKAAEQARIAEAEVTKAADNKAEQEAVEKLAASRPKVNTGKYSIKTLKNSNVLKK